MAADRGQPDRFPTGLSDDGTIFYTESDLTASNGLSITLLPIGEVPLLLKPSAPKNSTKEYSGKPTPILCKLIGTHRYFRCHHEITEANEKTGEPARYCSRQWQSSSTVTAGTLKTHARAQHWKRSGSNIKQIAGQVGLFAAFQK